LGYLSFIFPLRFQTLSIEIGRTIEDILPLIK